MSGLSSPMNNPHPTPKVRSTSDEANMQIGPHGQVNKVAADILSGAQQSKRDATGERESELSKKQGW
jgi:hypothetical protein